MGIGQTCSLTVSAGPDQAVCSPSPVQLSGSSSAAPADILSIQWQPAAGLSNPATFNPITAVTSTVTYHLTVTAYSDSNLITNGAFNNGINGYTTNYIPGTGGSFGTLSNPGTYAINTNPRNTHTNFAIFGDHTTGTGNMLVVNGDSAANSSIFCQSISVQPNTIYAFSVWGASCVASAPAALELRINGSVIGSAFTLSTATGNWQQYLQQWNSGLITSATVCLYDTNRLNSGNDFAIDDVAFREICSASDSVTLSLGAVGVMQLGPDTVLCTGQTLTLNATVTGATRYLWNTGDTLPVITVSAAGLYYATASIFGTCPVTDSIRITGRSYPVISPLPDTSFCNGDSVYVTVSASPATGYLWQDGITAASRYISVAGLYNVTVTNGGCTSADTLLVTSVSLSPFSLGADTALCLPDSIVLLAPAVPPGAVVTWSDGSHGNSLAVYTPGIYRLQIDFGACSESALITVSPGNCSSIFIPNVFTPNGDGRNDTWQIYQVNAAAVQIRLFNRWGQLLASSDDPDFSWDGRYRNSACSQGVYYYLVEIETPAGEKESYRGTVTLIR
jgi:gliding motility-associated-like protein